MLRHSIIVPCRCRVAASSSQPCRCRAARYHRAVPLSFVEAITCESTMDVRVVVFVCHQRANVTADIGVRQLSVRQRPGEERTPAGKRKRSPPRGSEATGERKLQGKGRPRRGGAESGSPPPGVAERTEDPAGQADRRRPGAESASKARRGVGSERSLQASDGGAETAPPQGGTALSCADEGGMSFKRERAAATTERAAARRQAWRSGAE